MEKVRCFVAIELPEQLTHDLLALQECLRAGSPPGVRWVHPRSIHLTLKFLGNVPSDGVPRIVTALEQAALGIAPFGLEAGGLGVFPNLRRARVVWVGLGGDITALRELQQRVEDALAPLGFPAEARGFTPHLTLARVRDQVPAADRQALGQLVESNGFESASRIEVSHIRLMRSQLTGRGAIYSTLHSTPLGGDRCG